MADSPDLYEQREALLKEQRELLKRLDVAATNITHNRVRLHTERLDDFDRTAVESAQELAERDAASFQQSLEKSFERSDAVEAKIADAETGHDASEGTSRRMEREGYEQNLSKAPGPDPTERTIHGLEREDHEQNRSEELDRALEDRERLREQVRDPRVDRTYTTSVLQSAERQVSQAEEEMRRSRSP